MKDVISISAKELITELDNRALRAVQEVGIIVDKDKLSKALQASEFVDRLIEHIFLLYTADEYMPVRAILEMLVEHEFIVHTEETSGQYVRDYLGLISSDGGYRRK